jgi:hypothetical protein
MIPHDGMGQNSCSNHQSTSAAENGILIIKLVPDQAYLVIGDDPAGGFAVLRTLPKHKVDRATSNAYIGWEVEYRKNVLIAVCLLTFVVPPQELFIKKQTGSLKVRWPPLSAWKVP